MTWWAARVSNPRPLACQASALPAELAARPQVRAGRTRHERTVAYSSRPRRQPHHRVADPPPPPARPPANPTPAKTHPGPGTRLNPTDHWRRNLAALWFAQFTAIFGFSFALPFLPVYLRQLGVPAGGQLALWSGVAASASGMSLMVMGPIWGALADRY